MWVTYLGFLWFPACSRFRNGHECVVRRRLGARWEAPERRLGAAWERAVRHDGQVPSAIHHPPLVRAALETERHVAATGWDQPPRLFALVRTASLLAREPALRATLGAPDGTPDEDGFTAVEQEGMPRTSSLESMLGRLAWPPEVDGVALAVERVVVPPEAERDLPADPDAAVEALAAHPDRRDVRLFVAVLRDGGSTCLLRQRAHDSDDKVAVGEGIAPGLVAALAATLEE